MPWAIPPWLALVKFLRLTAKEHDDSDDVDNDVDSSNKVITSSTHCPISRRFTFNKTNEWIVPSKREKISTDLYQLIYQLVCSFGKMASFMGTTTNKSVGPI